MLDRSLNLSPDAPIFAVAVPALVVSAVSRMSRHDMAALAAAGAVEAQDDEEEDMDLSSIQDKPIMHDLS